MKKIGILTLYYKSQNYGGLLQAYALVKAIDKYCNVSAEQICYDAEKYYSIKHKLYVAYKRIYACCFSPEKNLYKKFKARRNACFDFAESIPHSKKVYDIKNIKETNNIYDIFIVGSDQVWRGYSDVFSLSFVKNNRIAYSVSTGGVVYDEATGNKYRKELSKYQDISVREHESIEMITQVSGKEVTCTVDPTLLLSKDDWDELVKDRLVTEDYVFCYFLGVDIRLRKLAELYAKENHLKIVCLPNMQGKYEKADLNFGDYRLYNISPADFISLIKYSSSVFTDSYHATVFSLLYDKLFFVFYRANSLSMSSRIRTLVELFECQNNYCDTDNKFTLDYLNSIQTQNNKKNMSKFKKSKVQSIEFLKKNLQN